MPAIRKDEEDEERATSSEVSSFSEEFASSSSGISGACTDSGSGTDTGQQPQHPEYVWRLSDELRELARTELGETDAVRSARLSRMRAYVASRPHLRETCRTDDAFLLRFLRCQKFDLDRSCQLLEQYLLLREKHPGWFKQLDPEDEMVAELVRAKEYSAFSECTFARSELFRVTPASR